MAGGDFRAATSGSSVTGFADVTPDGKWVLYPSVEGGKPGLFRVAVNGGSPVRLGDYPSSSVGPSVMAVSPDGQNVAALDGNFDNPDVWILENFVPPAAKAK
jgi:Tol biopolymer transport system component